jgi:hypothetical protein
MGERPPGLTLRRLDSDCDYSPENCHWAPRLTKDAKVWGAKTILCDGVDMPLSEASRIKGIPIGLLRYRLAHGWPPEKALQLARQQKKRTHPFPPDSAGEATFSTTTIHASDYPEFHRK